MSATEDKGLGALTSKTSEVDEKRLLEHAGLFGLNAAVAGLGMIALTSHTEAGKGLLKFGAIIAAAMYGTRYLAEHSP